MVTGPLLHIHWLIELQATLPAVAGVHSFGFMAGKGHPQTALTSPGGALYYGVPAHGPPTVSFGSVPADQANSPSKMGIFGPLVL